MRNIYILTYFSKAVTKSYLVLAYAVTPIHVGAGRAPGVVDLPVQRDTIGYPIVYGSSFKGVLRSYFEEVKKKGNGSGQGENWGKVVDCLFGGDIEGPGDKPAGRLIFTDLIPVFYPVASLDGYVYVTTDYLLRRVDDIMSVVGTGNNKIFVEDGNVVGELRVILTRVMYSKVIKPGDEITGLGSLIKNTDKIYVLSNKDGLRVIESALIRVTRNVLDDKKKTSRNIWTEEYIPHGTVFIGAIFETKRRAEECEDVEAENAIKKLNGASVFMGGKETVGKGLVRLKVLGMDGRG